MFMTFSPNIIMYTLLPLSKFFHVSCMLNHTDIKCNNSHKKGDKNQIDQTTISGFEFGIISTCMAGKHFLARNQNILYIGSSQLLTICIS